MSFVLVLAKKSALRVHLEREEERGFARVQELLAQNDATVARMRGAHEQHEQALTELNEALVALGCEVRLVVAAALDEFRVVIDHPAQGLLPSTSVHDSTRPSGRRPVLVITLGGDGTLLAASHAIGDTPVLAINSAPDFSVGFFCGGRLGSIQATLARALEGELEAVQLRRMRIERNGELLSQRVLNEALVCSASPAATTRYLLQHRGVVEEQKSSGIWIGPAAGSTAAQRSAGGRILPLASDKLQFVVREPYTPAGESLRFPRGLVAPDQELVVRMKTADGRVFVDGPHEVHEATLGDVLTFRASEEPLTLLGVSRRRGWR